MMAARFAWVVVWKCKAMKDEERVVTEARSVALSTTKISDKVLRPWLGKKWQLDQ